MNSDHDPRCAPRTLEAARIRERKMGSIYFDGSYKGMRFGKPTYHNEYRGEIRIGGVRYRKRSRNYHVVEQWLDDLIDAKKHNQKECEWCGQTFQATNANQRFCCPECKRLNRKPPKPVTLTEAFNKFVKGKKC